MKYVSRSQIETWRRCPRKGWLTYGYKGVGITPTCNYVPLVDGNAVHHGVATILKTGDIELAVKTSLTYYNKQVKDAPFAEVADQYQQHTKAEQSALVEALVRVWHLREYPQILARYEIKIVEKEISMPLTDELVFLSTADAVFQEKSSRDIYVYSLKTMASYDPRAEKTYRADLQGTTESLAMEKKLNRRIAGIRYCFLIKGARYKQKDQNDEFTGLWIQDSPLIVAWKRITPQGILYAHKYRVPNEYGPGWTTLGKGWVKVNIWEEPGMTIKKWVNMLHAEQVQPSTINVVSNSCHVPVEKFRYPREMEETLVQITADSKRIKYITETLEKDTSKLHKLVSMNGQSCYYPGECQFTRTVCYRGTGQSVEESVEDAIAEGKLQWRTSHHPIEQKWMEQKELQARQNKTNDNS